MVSLNCSLLFGARCAERTIRTQRNDIHTGVVVARNHVGVLAVETDSNEAVGKEVAVGIRDSRLAGRRSDELVRRVVGRAIDAKVPRRGGGRRLPKVVPAASERARGSKHSARSRTRKGRLSHGVPVAVEVLLRAHPCAVQLVVRWLERPREASNAATDRRMERRVEVARSLDGA